MTPQRHPSESGFTLIEVMVAALILVIAFTALGAVFINGQSEASADVQESQLINAADQQIELVRSGVVSVGFDDLAMSTVPSRPSVLRTVQSTWASPNTFVEAGASPCGATTNANTSYWDFEIASNYDSVNTAASGPPYGVSPSGFVPWTGCTQSEPLEVIAPSATNAYPAPLIRVGGTEVPCGGLPITSPCSVSEGGASFDVYTFVTDTYVGCDSGASGSGSSVTCPPGAAPNTPISPTNPVNTASCAFPATTTASTPCADARRVTVTVVPITQVNLTVKAKNQRITPVYVSSIFTNPTPSGSSQSSSIGLTLGLGI